jgi:hypothetical protein
VEFEINGAGFGWSDLNPANLAKAGRKRLRKAIDGATVTVSGLPPIDLRTPTEVSVSGDGSTTATFADNTIWVVAALAAGVFFLARR